MGDEWKRIRLREVCVKIGSGATPRGGKEAYKGGATSLIRSQNIYNQGFQRNGLVHIDDNQAADLRNVEVEANDVLLNITGDSVARCCQVAGDVLPARVNQHVAIIRPRSDRLDAQFLRYVLISGEFQSHLLTLASAGATRPALTKTMIEDLVVPLPPLPTQRAIAHVLGTLDDLIELNRETNEILEEMARALFKSWFVDFDPVRAKLEGRPPAGMDEATAALFPDHFQDSELGQIPKGWEVKPLGDVVELAYGKPLKAEDRKNGDVCVYGSNGIVGQHDEKLVTGPGIVVGRKGNPGIVTWAHGDFYPIDTTFYVVRNSECQSLHFLYYALAFQDLPNLSADSAVPGLNRNHAYMSKQVIPPVALLEAFDAQIAPIFETIHAQSEESRYLATLRDTLLPKLLSGEVRLNDFQNAELQAH